MITGGGHKNTSMMLINVRQINAFELLCREIWNYIDDLRHIFGDNEEFNHGMNIIDNEIG